MEWEVIQMSKISDLIFKGEPHYITQGFSKEHNGTDYGTYHKNIPQYAIEDGTIEYVNKKFCQLTGYAKEEVLGRNPRILKSGELPDFIYQELWQKISSGKNWQGEFLYQCCFV